MFLLAQSATKNGHSDVGTLLRFYAAMFPHWPVDVNSAPTQLKAVGACSWRLGLVSSPTRADERNTDNGHVIVTRSECPVWLDVLTERDDEMKAVSALAESLGWRAQQPIDIPDAEAKYVTMFGADGDTLCNSLKMTGVLPRHLLLNDDDDGADSFQPPVATGQLGGDAWSQATRALDAIGADVLPFFGAKSAQHVDELVERAQSLGGAVVREPFEADGIVAVLRDPGCAHFAVYHRTDDPDQVKPNTRLMHK
jgi:hypothetical protein